MAKMIPQKHEIEEFNGGTGNEYGMQISDASDFTKVVENATYSAKVADSLANSGVDNTEANNVGTAQVEITGTGTAKKFKFKNLKGETGNGISKVEKTSTSGLTDTYTITYTSGSTTTFNVKNGKGITGIAKTGSAGLVDTYTVTFNDSTSTTFTVTNGEKGDKGDTGLTPNLQIGNTTTLETGQPATATITGTTDNPTLNLGLPKGNTGSQGIQGKSYVPKGEWSSATAYVNNATTIDTVLYLGSTYYCKQSNTNQTPTNTTYWGLLAEKGEAGEVTTAQMNTAIQTAIYDSWGGSY